MSLKSLRNHEGYLLLDHRASPGIDPNHALHMGLPLGAARGLFEAATYTCKHCQAVVVINPDRKRERAYCRGCDHLICDTCAVVKAQTLTCRTFEQVIDQMLSSQES